MNRRRTVADLALVGFFALLVAGLWAFGARVDAQGHDGAPFRGLAGLLSLSLGMMVALRFTPLRRQPGLLFGLLLLGLLIGVNFAPEVSAKQVEAFGPDVAGIPMPVVVSVVEALGLGPAVIALGLAGLPLASAGLRAGAGGGWRLLAWVVRGNVPPELLPHRRLALATGAWCLGWAAAWTLYAGWRGI